MSRTVIQFDIDGVLADFVLGFTTKANELFGTAITSTHEQPCWDGFPGMTKGQIDKVWEVIKHDANFWRYLEPLIPLSTIDQFHRLQYEDCDLYFVTSRVGDDPKWQTERWLQGLGIKRPTVIISKYKGEVARCLGATHSIEDKAGNAICIQHMSNAKSYIIDRKYNQFPHDTVGTKVKRVSTVEEFLNDIEGTNT